MQINNNFYDYLRLVFQILNLDSNKINIIINKLLKKLTKDKINIIINNKDIQNYIKSYYNDISKYNQIKFIQINNKLY